MRTDESSGNQLTVAHVDALLTDFHFLLSPPEPDKPQQNNDLLRTAIEEAFRAETKHKANALLASSLGTPMSLPRLPAEMRAQISAAQQRLSALRSDPAKMKAARAGLEKRKSEPTTAGLSDHYKDVAEENYRRLDPDYAKAEAKARQKRADTIGEARKRADLLVVCVREPLLRQSELAHDTGAGQAWNVYRAALQYNPDWNCGPVRVTYPPGTPGPDRCIVAVLQDLERVKAKIEWAGKAAATPQTINPAPRKTLPDRVESSYRQYQCAEKALSEQDKTKPTDQQCHDWLQAHNDGDPLPVFDTWQRYVRQARKHYGEQKNAPRAGRESGSSMVRPGQLSHTELRNLTEGNLPTRSLKDDD